MQIVTDSGTDLRLNAGEEEGLNIHTVPLTVTLDEKSYREGIDIQHKDFYDLLEASGGLPTTSQPSAGEFAEMYRKVAQEDPDILSIHITSGLSGTYNAALEGAKLVPEANVTHIDTKTLTAASGWQVYAAARAIKAGWDKEKILGLVKRIGDATDCMYTLDELKYLIHGGRISHMKGLIASMLNLKPLIGVEKVGGTYIQLGQTRTFKRALKGLANLVSEQYKHALGTKMMVQVLYSDNHEGGQMLRDMVDDMFECTWLPMGPMSLVLGAHTGRSMVGVGFCPMDVFSEIP